MKLLMIGTAAAAALFAALPASAQVEVRGPGASVVIGDGPHYGYRDGYGYRERHWRHSYAECRTVRTKTRLPNGDVIVRTRRVC